MNNYKRITERPLNILYSLCALLIVCMACSLESCGPKRKITLQSEIDARKSDSLKHPPEYEAPEIPRMIIGDNERAEFLAYHFWDNYNYSDTINYKAFPLVTERAFVNFIGVLHNISTHAASAVIQTNLVSSQTHGEIFDFFCSLYEKYLYNPNSAMRNEELYIAVLKYIVESDKISDLDKIRPRYRLDMAMKNRPGDIASDFSYILANGAKGHLHGIKARYLLLFFYDSECAGCEEIRFMISTSVNVNELQALGQLKVMAVYIGENLPVWRKSRKQLPDSWIAVADQDGAITKKSIYDLKAIPTIYLLDYNKQVIAKDIIPEYLDSILLEL